MEHIRLSTAADIPALRRLWTLAFGDGGAYLDNFFDCYYRPERMIVLEWDGEVLAMTAWFDTAFVLPGEGEYRAAYLYAVATHPDHRGQGLSGRLLAWADDHFRTLNIPAVTTVPATPSLHNFFAANGFRECFCHDEVNISPGGNTAPCTLSPISPAEYGRLREAFLAHQPHILLPEDAITYQQGCSRISGGGLYAAQSPAGQCILCAEGMENGTLLVKELLGQPSACEEIAQNLHSILPGFSGICRFPGKEIPFGMLKWLEKSRADGWNWNNLAYLGLAFD